MIAVAAVGVGAAVVGFGAPLPLHMYLSQRAKRKSASFSGIVSSKQDDAEFVNLVVVHVHQAVLGPELAGKKLVVRTVYGKEKAYSQTQLAQLQRDPVTGFITRVGHNTMSSSSAAKFEELCCFMANEKKEPVIQLQLREQHSAGRRLLGTAEVRLPEGSAEMGQECAELQGQDSKVIGRLSVTVAVRAVNLGELREYMSSEIGKFQSNAVFASRVPFHVGTPEDEEVAVAGPVVRGIPPSASAPSLASLANQGRSSSIRHIMSAPAVLCSMAQWRTRPWC